LETRERPKFVYGWALNNQKTEACKAKKSPALKGGFQDRAALTGEAYSSEASSLSLALFLWIRRLSACTFFLFGFRLLARILAVFLLLDAISCSPVDSDRNSWWK
jgi:hypothetical protein